MSRLVRVPKKGIARRLGIPPLTILRAMEVGPYVSPGGCKHPSWKSYRLSFLDGSHAGIVDNLTGWKLAPHRTRT